MAVPGGFCNYRCPFCHREGDWSSDVSKTFSIEEIRASYAAVQEKIAGVAFTGGEPLLNPYLPDYIRAITERGARVQITTNGSLLLPQAVDEFADIGLSRLVVSIPSATGKIYRLLTNQREYAIEDIVQGVTYAARKGLSVTVNSVMCKGFNDSQKELSRLIELCMDTGAERLKLLEIYPSPEQPTIADLFVSISHVQLNLPTTLDVICREQTVGGVSRVLLRHPFGLGIELWSNSCVWGFSHSHNLIEFRRDMNPHGSIREDVVSELIEEVNVQVEKRRAFQVNNNSSALLQD